MQFADLERDTAQRMYMLDDEQRYEPLLSLELDVRTWSTKDQRIGSYPRVLLGWLARRHSHSLGPRSIVKANTGKVRLFFRHFRLGSPRVCDTHTI
jgi:hypothetical protein